MATPDLVFNETGLSRLLLWAGGPVADDILQRTVMVERVAKRLCPVDTGTLRGSISHTLGMDLRGIFGIVGTNIHYGPFVEFGTRYMNAQPFLRPALEAAR